MALGESRVAVFTSKGFLRVFTLGGTQITVGVCWDILTMTTFNDCLFAITKEGDEVWYFLLDLVSESFVIENTKLPSCIGIPTWITVTENMVFNIINGRN